MNKDAFSVSGFYRWNRLQIDPEPVLESFASTGTKYLVFDAETTFTFPEKLSFVQDLYKKAERYGINSTGCDNQPRVLFLFAEVLHRKFYGRMTSIPIQPDAWGAGRSF
jgi:hypothetical protein